jgi:hypothetical protein
MSEFSALSGRTAPAPISNQPVLLRRKCACGGSSDGECEACKKDRLQRSALDADSVTSVPPIVHDVLRAPGAPLDAATRAVMEPHFGHDFGKVRVHADAAAAESARAVHAAAYAVGRDVVFASGQYAPGTRAGQRLMAHELAHVVQQRSEGSGSLAMGPVDDPAEREAARAADSFAVGHHQTARAAVGAPGVVRRASWGTEYDAKDEAREAKLKAGIGEIKETSKIDPMGTEAADEIPPGVLEKIYPFLKADLDKGKVTAATVERYRNYLNKAFQVMKINTVEAQANFLAHASEESGQFRAFTETQGESQHWEEDPGKVKLTPSALPKDKDVNPKGNWEFIGRGAVQVTHEGTYVEVIAELEKAAEQYQRDAKKGDTKAADLAAKAQAAADAVKANPQNAAKPEYAFLVSAAMMKRKEGDRKASQNNPSKVWTGGDSPSGWVGGVEQARGTPQFDALGRKAAAYRKIYCVLLQEAKAKGKKVTDRQLKNWSCK